MRTFVKSRCSIYQFSFDLPARHSQRARQRYAMICLLKDEFEDQLLLEAVFASHGIDMSQLAQLLSRRHFFYSDPDISKLFGMLPGIKRVKISSYGMYATGIIVL